MDTHPIFVAWSWRHTHKVRNRAHIRRLNTFCPQTHSTSFPLSELVHRSAALTGESRSELGAAWTLLVHGWRQVRDDGAVQLPHRVVGASESSSTRIQKLQKFLFGAKRLRNNFVRYFLDILVSVIIAVMLIGLFVAETSGTVASGAVVSDTVAKISSNKCTVLDPTASYSSSFWNSDTTREAEAYVEGCYKATSASAGCNDFFNQSIAHVEATNDECPFRDNVCAKGDDMVMYFDTGNINANILGVNTPSKWAFRRRAACAPVMPNGSS